MYLGELYLGEGGDVAIAPIVERIDAAYFSHMPSNNSSAAKIRASNAIITIAWVSTSPSKTKPPACQKKPKARLIVGDADRMLTVGDIQGVWRWCCPAAGRPTWS